MLGEPIELNSLDGLSWGCECVALEAQERENDVGQSEECERHSRQLAEETTLRDTSCVSLGLLVAPLKTRQSQPINCCSSHFLASRKVSPRTEYARRMPMCEGSILLGYFAVVRPYSFAIRKALGATREKSFPSTVPNLGPVSSVPYGRGSHGKSRRCSQHHDICAWEGHRVGLVCAQNGRTRMFFSPRTRLDVFGFTVARPAVLSNGAVLENRSWNMDHHEPIKNQTMKLQSDLREAV